MMMSDRLPIAFEKHREIAERREEVVYSKQHVRKNLLDLYKEREIKFIKKY